MTEPDPLSPEQMLLDYAGQTLVLDKAVVALAQAEQGVVARAHGEVELNGQATDITGLMLDLAVPRVERLAQMHERLGLALRRTLALRARLMAGWPRRGGVEERRVTLRPPAERPAGRTPRAGEDDPDERFRMPDEELWDPGLRELLETQPPGAVMACVARDVGAVQAEVASWSPPAPVRRAGGISPELARELAEAEANVAEARRLMNEGAPPEAWEARLRRMDARMAAERAGQEVPPPPAESG